MSDPETMRRLEQAREKYAPAGYDPASDDLTIPFAMELVEKDRQIAALREALNLFVVHSTYPVSTEINRRGYSWRDERALDYAFDEAIKALGAIEQTAGEKP